MRRRLDERGRSLGAIASEFAVPRDGWLAAVRHALGMTTRDLGAALGVADSTVARFEATERAGSIQLNSLRRVADALGCDVVYALVPRRPLEQVVREQALRKAAEVLGAVEHTMLLEGQLLSSPAWHDLVDELVAEAIDRRGLWHP